MADFFDGEILTVSCAGLKITMIIEAMELMRELILLCYEEGIGIPFELKEEIKGFNQRVQNYIIDEGEDEED